MPPPPLGIGEVYAEEYIDAVRDAENTYASDTDEEFLTRLRQLYYPGLNPVGLTFREAFFDQLMLNAPIRLPDGRRRMIGGAVGGVAFARLATPAYENAQLPAPPDNPSPYLIDAEDHRVDIGHVLLTIDAIAHTRTGAPYVDYGIPSIDPAWWVADIGSAAVWAERDGPNAPRVLPRLASGAPDVAGYFQMSAPDADLYGDVDGFSIMNLWIGTGGKLSDILTTYYLGGAGIDAGYHRRFRIFVGAHFGPAAPPGSPVPFPGVARAMWIGRINRFCDLFADDTSALNPLATHTRRSWAHVENVFDRFLAWLFAGLLREQLAHP